MYVQLAKLRGGYVLHRMILPSGRSTCEKHLHAAAGVVRPRETHVHDGEQTRVLRAASQHTG
jgi:hypothetical protein